MKLVINSLHINLDDKTWSAKSHPYLREFIGGVGTASKLIHDYFDRDPLVFSIGPLNGFFPYASKTCTAFLHNGKFVDAYAGGRLSTRIKFCGYDSIILEGGGRSDEEVFLAISEDGVEFLNSSDDLDGRGIAGKRCVVKVLSESVSIDGYFEYGYPRVLEKFSAKKIGGIVFSAGSSSEVPDFSKYEKEYFNLLSEIEKLTVKPAGKPSCSGCPVGCRESKVGEVGGNVLVHSLCACSFAEPVYSEISRAFACLSALGYDYTHEDVENLPALVYATIGKIYEKIPNS